MRENIGITLIALIITIIILIILTAITINNVIGTDLIGFATKAAENYMDAAKEEEEKISELISKGASAVPSTPITPPPATGGIGSSEVAYKLKEYQGKYVDIGLDTNGDSTVNDWEIFYATENRIFLIATDYVPVTKLEAWDVIGDSGALNGNGFKKYNDSYTYSACWPSVPTTFLDLPTETTDFLSLVMHNEYSLTDHQSQTNAIVVSHLLNTTAWKGIKDAANTEKQQYIDFVIGGPTLEMWCAAWNKAVAGDANGFVTIEPDPKTDGTGYNVKHDTTSNTYLYMNGTTNGLGENLSTLGSSYPLFFPHTTSKDNCYGYWLASPSASYSYFLMCVDCNNGCVSICGYNDSRLGVRPLVCLEFGVSLTYNAETEVYTLS